MRAASAAEAFARAPELLGAPPTKVTQAAGLWPLEAHPVVACVVVCPAAAAYAALRLHGLSLGNAMCVVAALSVTSRLAGAGAIWAYTKVRHRW